MKNVRQTRNVGLTSRHKKKRQRSSHTARGPSTAPHTHPHTHTAFSPPRICVGGGRLVGLHHVWLATPVPRRDTPPTPASFPHTMSHHIDPAHLAAMTGTRTAAPARFKPKVSRRGRGRTFFFFPTLVPHASAPSLTSPPPSLSLSSARQGQGHRHQTRADAGGGGTASAGRAAAASGDRGRRRSAECRRAAAAARSPRAGG